MSGTLPIFVLNTLILDNVSMDANRSSAVIDLAETMGYAVHSVWTGTPDGFISTQGSNDGVNFVEVDSVATGGAAGQHLLNVEKHHYRYVRVQFIFTSGPGVLNTRISGKRG